MDDVFHKKFGFEKTTENYGVENASFEAVPNLDQTREKAVT